MCFVRPQLVKMGFPRLCLPASAPSPWEGGNEGGSEGGSEGEEAGTQAGWIDGWSAAGLLLRRRGKNSAVWEARRYLLYIQAMCSAHCNCNMTESLLLRRAVRHSESKYLAERADVDQLQRRRRRERRIAEPLDSVSTMPLPGPMGSTLTETT